MNYAKLREENMRRQSQYYKGAAFRYNTAEGQRDPKSRERDAVQRGSRVRGQTGVTRRG